MGFLDKLKSVAKNASEYAAKAGEERAKNALIDSLDRCGSAEGENIPEKAEFCLDKTNERIIIRSNLIGNHHNLICEYSYDDVVSFKLKEYSEKKLLSSRASIFSYLTLTLASGKSLEVCNIIDKYDDSDSNDLHKQKEEKCNEIILDIILAFIDKTQDNETIKWANGFLAANGYTELEYFE